MISLPLAALSYIALENSKYAKDVGAGKLALFFVIISWVLFFAAASVFVWSLSVNMI